MSSTGSSNANSSGAEHLDDDGKNAAGLACPHCGCLILQAGVGTFITDHELDVPLIYLKKDRTAGDGVIMETEKLSRWWFVTDMFAFENIGFTHAHEGRKFLACADCEIGPLGVVEEPTPTLIARYLISVERLRPLSPSGDLNTS